MSRRNILLGLLVLSVVLAAGWFLATRESAHDAAVARDEGGSGGASGDGARGGRANGVGGPGTPGHGASRELPPLDCNPPAAGNAATVDGEPITSARLCSWLARIGGTTATDVDRAQARLVLDRMIDGVLVSQALVRENAAVTVAEVTAAVAQLGVTAPSGGSGKPEPGVDPALLMEQVRQRLELQKLAGLHAKVAVSEQDVDAELAAGAPGIDRGQGVRVEAWTIRLAPAASAEAQARAEQAAKSFAKAVPAQAPDVAARAHGLVHQPAFLLGANGLEPALEEAGFALAKGQWSGAIRTRIGWTVVRALERVEGTRLDEPQLRARVRRALETRRTQAATKDVLTRLRNAAKVEIFVDV